MVVDIYIIVLFFLVLFRYQTWFFWLLACVGFLVLEIYSLLPFGFNGSALVLGLFTVRIASDLFDASSVSAWVLAFTLGIITYSVSLVGMYYVVIRVDISELFLRGGLFLSHQFLLALFTGITLYGLRFSIKLFSYAFLEEKFTF
ncbi:MAG: hypothetical protein AAB482_04270 [Patescibacteria group bacterium]